MIQDWIEQNITSHIRYTNTETEIHVCCPVCGETRYRLYINLTTGQIYCHNCQFKGTIVKLIQYVENISYTAAQERFNTIKGNMVLPDNVEDALERRWLVREIPAVQKRAVSLPDEFQLISSSTNAVAQQAERYLAKRGITQSQIDKHQIGICATGQYANRIIIPIYQEGQLKFWVARAMNSEAKLKEKSPSNSFYQFGKSDVIFNLDQAANKYHSVVISEGIFDALSWGDIGISLLGKSLYDAQFNLLMGYRNQLSEGVYIALDADAGKDAIIIAKNLSPFFPVKIIHIPSEFDDPNQYLITHSKSDMWKLIARAVEFEEFTALRDVLNGG